jgi:hypothetical protein
MLHTQNTPSARQKKKQERKNERNFLEKKESTRHILKQVKPDLVAHQKTKK